MLGARTEQLTGTPRRTAGAERIPGAFRANLSQKAFRLHRSA